MSKIPNPILGACYTDYLKDGKIYNSRGGEKMYRFLIILAVILIPAVSFGAEKCVGNMECTTVGGAVCRDACQAGETIVSQVQLLEGEHKGAIVCTQCFTKDKNGKVLKTNGKFQLLKRFAA
jgi:hypothetical protein